MVLIRELCAHLESIAPASLAEDWDNVGLLVGDTQRPVQRLMTCLTVTPDTVEEAIDRRADLIVTHHPFPFRPLKRMTTNTTVGRMLWQLAGNGISVYSPHTAWDSARCGINQQLAQGLELTGIRPLQPIADAAEDLGSGRCGIWPRPSKLSEAVERVKDFLSIDRLQYVGRLDQTIRSVAVACGSAGTFLGVAHRAGCQLLITGETSFHTYLEADALGVALVLPGHFASERFSLETLAQQLQTKYQDVEIWASKCEADPVRFA